MRTRKLNDDVLYADDEIIQVGGLDMEALKEAFENNPSRRIRLCTHRNIEDQLHEMFIIHHNYTYVRPHKHLFKSVSFHVIEGSADVIIFDEVGNITNVIQLKEPSSRQNFYCRVSDPYYYTQLIHSDVFVFLETTSGPFQRADTIFAPWAPDEGDGVASRNFLDQLKVSASQFLESQSKNDAH